MSHSWRQPAVRQEVKLTFKVKTESSQNVSTKDRGEETHINMYPQLHEN